MPDTTYQFPPLSIYKHLADDDMNRTTREEIDQDWHVITQILADAQVNATVTSSISGRQATRFELQLGPGVPLEALGALRKELKRAFADRGPVMMLLPIPGRDRAGIEVPNRRRVQRTSGDLFASSAWANTTAQLPLMLGIEILGSTSICDLASAQHLLMAGDDAVTLTAVLRQAVCSIAMRFTPAEVRMLIFDSQSRDMRPFGQLPHLIIPPVSSVPGAIIMLSTLHDEMRYRQQLCVKANVQSIGDFNAQHPNEQQPRIILFLDEFSPLLKHARRDEILAMIQALTAGSRVGIHMVLSTRYPYADNMPAELTSAIPWRIASHTNSPDSSLVIIDREGTADLLGAGDVLFRNDSTIQRCLCGDITEAECREVTKFCSRQCPAQPDADLQAAIAQADLDERNAAAAAKAAAAGPDLPFADLLPSAPAATANDALKAILEKKEASPEVLMAAFGMNRERATNLLDELTAHDYLKPAKDSSGKREINYAELPSEAVLNGETGRKTIAELYAELEKKVAEGDASSRTVAEYNKGVHAIGKKIVEEASEVWMAAEYETVDNTTLEISELIYHLLVMMLKKGIKLEDLYKKL